MTSTAALGGGESGEAFRWPICALVVLALHAIGLAALITWRAQVVPGEAPAVMLMMDLEPAPVPAPPPPPSVAEIVEPEPPEIPIVVPEAMPIKEPEIAIPPPKPKPALRKPPQPRVEKIPDSSPQPPVHSSSAASAPATAAIPPASVAAPPSPDAITDFQRLLMAQLNRAKRYPPLAQRRHAQGVAYLRFTMDRSGRVLAAQLERSSGQSDLDEEVLALIKRADPLPPIPPDLAQDRLELVVPVQFSLR